MTNYKAVVMGLSSGGMDAMKFIFEALPGDYGIPIVIVQHISPRSDSTWIEILNQKYPLHIKEAEEKEPIKPGTAYLAPPNYHLLIEKDGSLSLSIDERVSYARPAIDVLFDSAAEAFREHLIGIVMTGSNHDGTAGLQKIKSCGGVTIVQDPESAFSSYMPQQAMEQVDPHHVLSLEEIVRFLNIQNQYNYEIPH